MKQIKFYYIFYPSFDIFDIPFCSQSVDVWSAECL